MSSSLDDVREDLKDVQAALESEQDPVRRKDLQDRRWNLRAELRRLQQSPGACSLPALRVIEQEKLASCCRVQQIGQVTVPCAKLALYKLTWV